MTLTAAIKGALCLALCAALSACTGGVTLMPVRSPLTHTMEETMRQTEMSAERSSPKPTITPKPTSEPLKAPIQNGAYVRVIKAERRLFLWKDGELLLDCPIGLGFEPEGDKEREGDGKTPEGIYYVCVRNDQSRYYLSLGVSYPDKAAAERGLDGGIISSEQYDDIIFAIDDGQRPPWNTALGGEIMIHGMGSSRDWTAGCVAVDNADMDVLWEHGTIGTPIEILP